MSQLGATARRPALDAVRGLAILAMISFHATWDLAYFGYIAADFPDNQLFRLYGHAIATTFLALVGISLVFAFRKSDPWPLFWARITKITCGAILITLVTRYYMPSEFIFFGILHCIVVSSLLALPFLRAPLLVVVAFIVLCLALPLMVASPILDAPNFWWLGLGTRLPTSNDIQPLVPWFGMVLLGILIARLGWLDRLPNRQPRWLQNSFTHAGRYSFSLYMAHQPLLFALFLAISVVFGPAKLAANPTLIGECKTQCIASGRESGACTKGCECFAKQIKAHGLWAKTQTTDLSQAEQQQIIGFAKLCVRIQDAAPTEK